MEGVQVVTSVKNALRVLEEVAATQQAGISQLARKLDMPKSSVHRLITTLCEAGWVRATSGEVPRYVLTSRALTVGRAASAEFGLREAALPEMAALRDATDETVHLSLLDGFEVVVVERVDSEQAVRSHTQLGGHGRLNGSASGKAMLAGLPPEVIERFIDGGLAARTERTITDPDVLRAQLETIRELGYASNFGESRIDVAAVAAAIHGDDGLPFAAINVSSPATRVTDDDLARFGGLVVEACARVEGRLGIRRVG